MNCPKCGSDRVRASVAYYDQIFCCSCKEHSDQPQIAPETALAGVGMAGVAQDSGNELREALEALRDLLKTEALKTVGRYLDAGTLNGPAQKAVRNARAILDKYQP